MQGQVNRDEITIYNAEYNQEVSVSEFLEKVFNRFWKTGRFLISGSNGTGKSSLLKLLKANFPEAILLSAESDMGEISVPDKTSNLLKKPIQLYHSA